MSSADDGGGGGGEEQEVQQRPHLLQHDQASSREGSLAKLPMRRRRRATMQFAGVAFMIFDLTTLYFKNIRFYA